MTTPLLDVQGLRIAFGPREVVHGVDFQLHAGEKLALVGESGSGKTISALALLGLVQGARVHGRAWFGTAQPVDLLSLPPRQLRGIRGQEIAMVFQEPMTALNPVITIGDQIAEVLRLKQGVSAVDATKGAIELLADVGLPEPERRARAYAHQLSGGQRQRAMIAMALACKPQILLADEPTTALDVTVRRQILDLLDRLQHKHQMAVLLITHDLNLVRQFADRVAVMEAGVLVEQGPVGRVFSDPEHPYTRRLLQSRPLRDVVSAQADAEVVMQGEGVRVTYPAALPGVRGWFRSGEFVAVHGAHWTVRAGQTLGVVGESGSGKSTLALAALGLQNCTGTLRVMKQCWGQDRTTDKQLRQQVQVVFQDPFSSLSPRMTVEDIVGEGLRVHAPHMSGIQRQAEVIAVLETVGLAQAHFPGLLQRYPHQFSGGQRQRLAIARALIVQPQLLVLDEPTSALDVTMAQQVLTLLQDLQRSRGLAYVLITHDVAVVRAMAHTVLVMQAGQIVESGPVAEVLDAPQHPYTRTLLAAAE